MDNQPEKRISKGKKMISHKQRFYFFIISLFLITADLSMTLIFAFWLETAKELNPIIQTAAIAIMLKIAVAFIIFTNYKNKKDYFQAFITGVYSGVIMINIMGMIR